MATEIILKDSEFRRVVKRLKRWANKESHLAVNEASIKIAKDYQERIKRGVDGKNGRIRKVKEKTMDMPIRFSTDPAIRRSVNSSKTGLVARGRAVDSIKKRSSGRREFEIGPTTPHGKKIFNIHSKPGKNRVARDPLIVSDVQMRIIEKEILKSIDDIIRG